MVEYNLAKVNVEGSSPFFCLYFLLDKWTQRQDLVFPNKLNYKGIKLELTFICDYRLIGKSFIFQVNIVGSSPTNHIIKIKSYNKGEMAEWLKAADCKFVEVIST